MASDPTWRVRRAARHTAPTNRIIVPCWEDAHHLRTYHGALAKLANPAIAGLRPTAARVLGALRNHGPLTAEQLAALLSSRGRTVAKATIDRALAELVAADAAAVHAQTRCWTLRPAAQHPLLEAVDLHGAHDFRHTFSTWLQDAGIPARVIDEVMGHEATSRVSQQRGSAMGAHYRHTTPEMAARISMAVEQRLKVVLEVAEQALEAHPKRSTRRVF
jgi:integrase